MNNEIARKYNLISFLKTKKSEQDIEKVVNQLVIQCNTDEITGKLYFDYDDEHRLEINSDLAIYKSINVDLVLQPDYKIAKTELTPLTLNRDILKGDLLSDTHTLAIVSAIENGQVSYNIISTTNPNKWNYYFE